MAQIINKDLILLEWLNTYETELGYIFFQWLGESTASRSVAVVSSSRNRPDILGIAQQEYTFALQAMLPLSESMDDINTESMRAMRLWQDWIDKQQEVGSYPDFGSSCFDYRLANLSDNPQLAQSFENGMAKYQFFAKLSYSERI